MILFGVGKIEAKEQKVYFNWSWDYVERKKDDSGVRGPYHFWSWCEYLVLWGVLVLTLREPTTWLMSILQNFYKTMILFVVQSWQIPFAWWCLRNRSGGSDVSNNRVPNGHHDHGVANPIVVGAQLFVVLRVSGTCLLLLHVVQSATFRMVAVGVCGCLHHPHGHMVLWAQGGVPIWSQPQVVPRLAQ